MRISLTSTPRTVACVALAVTALSGCGASQYASSGGQQAQPAATETPTETPSDTPTEAPSSGPTSTSAAAPSTCPPATGAGKRTTQFTAPPGQCIDPKKTYTATVKTDAGTFTIDLLADKAPKTVNNFVFLARHKFYDGVVFHRVIPGFMIQTGDPQGTGQGGPGYEFEDELPKEGEYQIGSVAMANTATPNTNGSQFFIVTGENGVALPPQYSLFGKVTSGMDVVKKIEAAGSPSGEPTTQHTMQDVTIAEK